MAHFVNVLLTVHFSIWFVLNRLAEKKIFFYYINGSVHIESNLITVQKDATVFSLFRFRRQIYIVDKKNQLDVTFLFFISLLIVAQHVSGNHVPIIRS